MHHGLGGTITPAGDGLAFATQGNVADYDVEVTGTLADALHIDGFDLDFRLDGPDIAVFGLLLPERRNR